MGNTSTFGTFTMARLGIYVAQHALTVTGNNISNINTKGYVRQNLNQNSMYFGGADRYQSRYDIRENGGVLARGVGQMRDLYLDIRYRNEMTRVGESDMKLDGLKQLSDIFDEVAKGRDGEGVLEARFNDMIQQLEEMLKDSNAGNDDIDSLVRASAEGLAKQFNSYAAKLETLTENETAKFKQELSATNTTLEKIRDLNETIRKTQIFGGTGLTLKDERNVLIDELSQQIGINVIYEMESLGDGTEVEKLRITTSGEPRRTLIDGIYGSQLSIVQEEREVPKLDEKGNPVLDKNGKPVLEKRFVDNANFDLAISELVDSRGTPDPAEPNDLEQRFTAEYLTTDKSSASYSQDNEWAKVKDTIKKLKFDTPAEAEAYEKALNEQFGYATDKSTTPYFHLSNAEAELGGGKLYVVHLHDATDPADKITKYSYANVEDANLTRLTDTELRGGLQAIREILTEAGEYTTANTQTTKDNEPLRYDEEAGTKRGIPYYQKSLDNLANTFARLINEANTLNDKDIFLTNKEGEFTDASGKVLDDQTNKANYVLKDGFKKYFEQDADGNFVTEKGGSTIATDPTQYVLKEEYKKYQGGPLFSNSGNSNDTDGITAANISVSKDWAHGLNHVLRSKDSDADKQSRLQDNIRHIITVMQSKQVFTNGTSDPATRFEGTFQEMLTDKISGTLAKDGNITETMLSNYNTTADEIYVDRDAVMGVDLNDEAMNMMQFQKAYSASCRLLTTYDTMLEKLINGTAI